MNTKDRQDIHVIANRLAGEHITPVCKPEERMPANFAALHAGKELYRIFLGLSEVNSQLRRGTLGSKHQCGNTHA